MKELMFSFSRSTSENAVMLRGTVSAVSSFLRAVTVISSRLALKIIARSAGGAVSACSSPGTSARALILRQIETITLPDRPIFGRYLTGIGMVSGCASSHLHPGGGSEVRLIYRITRGPRSPDYLPSLLAPATPAPPSGVMQDVGVETEQSALACSSRRYASN